MMELFFFLEAEETFKSDGSKLIKVQLKPPGLPPISLPNRISIIFTISDLIFKGLASNCWLVNVVPYIFMQYKRIVEHFWLLRYLRCFASPSSVWRNPGGDGGHDPQSWIPWQLPQQRRLHLENLPASWLRWARWRGPWRLTDCSALKNL